MFKCGMDFPVSDCACQFRLVVIGSLHSCAGVFINSCGLSHYKCKASYTHISAVVAVRTWALPRGRKQMGPSCQDKHFSHPWESIAFKSAI